MATLYSTQFAAVQGLVASSHTYTVPAGFIAIVRDIDAFADTSGTSTFLVARGPASNVFFYAEFLLATTSSKEWRGRQVLNTGETLVLQAGPAAVDVMASGYLLSMP